MRKLVDHAPLGADDIAAEVLAGLDRGDEVILPDPAARAAYELKQTDRAAYDETMRRQAAAPARDGTGAGMSEQGTTLEGASPVREEDAFDLDAVRRWLADQGTELGEQVEVQQFGGGASNLTYSLRDGRHDLILRRPPAGQKAKGAHDMAREHRVQEGLAGVFPLVPRMIALCTTSR